MSRFCGNMGGSHTKREMGVKNKGVMRVYREDLRIEAEERNAKTPHGRRRAHREGRCGGTSEMCLVTAIDARARAAL